MEFKVGDRVKVVCVYGFCNNSDLIGKVGTMVHVRTCDVGVQFDESFSSGHTCDSHGRIGYCYYGSPTELELISEANSNLTEITMEKKLFKVLVVDAKTGETTADKKVFAKDSQSALLKAFGHDVENSVIEIVHVGSITVNEPVQAVIVKSEK